MSMSPSVSHFRVPIEPNATTTTKNLTRKCVPFCEESENAILALLGQPVPPFHKCLNLFHIDLEDLRCKSVDEMVGKTLILLLHRTRKLTGVPESMEEPAQDTVSPLLRLPPFGPLSLVFIVVVRDGFVRDG